MADSFDLDKIKNDLRVFAKERNWEQFHNPKNLVMALSVESSELLEIFQWLTPEQSSQVMKDAELSSQVRDEVADIALYLSRLVDILDIDLAKVCEEKIQKNGKKYPISECYGNSSKR